MSACHPDQGARTTLPGVDAIGKVVDFAVDAGHGEGPYWGDIEKQNRITPVVPIRAIPLGSVILRSELLKDPRFWQTEVIKMAAGSNPSYLTDEQLGPVLERLSTSDLAHAGW